MRASRLALLPLVALTACDSGTDPAVQALVDYVLQYCGTAPLWVATQAQSGGPWTQVTLNASGQATIPLGEKFGIATIRQSGTSYFTYISYVTKTESPSFTGTCDAGSKSVNGTIATLTAGRDAQVTMDYRSAFLSAGGTTTFQLTGVTNGSRDVVGQQRVTATSAEDKVIVVRAQDIAAGGALAQLNFGGASALSPASATVTLTGVSASESRSVFSRLYTVANGSAYFNSPAATNTSGTVYNIAASQAIASDMFRIGLTVSGTQAGHGVNLYTHTFGNATLASGAALSTPTVTAASTSPRKLRLQLPSQTDYGAGIEFYYEQNTVGAYRTMSIFVSSAYLGGTPTTWDTQAPDLSGATGFPTASLFGAGTASFWQVYAYSNTQPYWNNVVKLSDNSVQKWAYLYSSTPVSPPSGSALRASSPAVESRRSFEIFGR